MNDKEKSLTAERARSLFSYDPCTGTFLWKSTGRGRINFPNVGTTNVSGYLFAIVDGKRHSLHRLAWLITFGKWPPSHIDHKNGNRKDNRLANLRLASFSVNAQNIFRPNKNNRSGLRGVSQRKNGRFNARIHVPGVGVKSLGFFDSAQKAHRAYLVAKRKIHPHSIPENSSCLS